MFNLELAIQMSAKYWHRGPLGCAKNAPITVYILSTYKLWHPFLTTRLGIHHT